MESRWNKEIFCTLGPASLNDRTIAGLEELGATLFRINLSHTKLAELARVIEYVQQRTAVPLCLDTEGAQVRTGDLQDKEIHVQEGSVVYIYREPFRGNCHGLNFYPSLVFDQLNVGDSITIDFDSVLVQVIDKDEKKIVVHVLAGGRIGQNKAVTVRREIALPVLTDKDGEALGIGMRMGLRHVALSFASQASDLDLIRSLCRQDTWVIAKIESQKGLQNLEQIAVKADALLIDRGDLSREVPIERIPRLQKTIIRCAQALNKKVYVATNLLESMVMSKTPTRAEVNDVYNTLLDGADGLVLAAETAIGKYPIGCATMIAKLIQEFQSDMGIPGSDFPQAEIVKELSILSDCDLETAFVRLNQTGFGALFVVNQENKMVGLVTDRELRKAILDRRGLSTPVFHVMNKNFIFGHAEESREEWIQHLRKSRRRQLPILDQSGALVHVVLMDELYYGTEILAREFR